MPQAAVRSALQRSAVVIAMTQHPDRPASMLWREGNRKTFFPPKPPRYYRNFAVTAASRTSPPPRVCRVLRRLAECAQL
jgi:hypothetical protein